MLRLLLVLGLLLMFCGCQSSDSDEEQRGGPYFNSIPLSRMHLDKSSGRLYKW